MINHAYLFRRYEFGQWALQEHITVIKENPFSIESGPDLPMAMAGHCQVYIGNNTVFIYGGVASLSGNTSVLNGYPVLKYSNLAWIGNGYQWSMVPTNSPCPSSNLPPTIMQQCALKGNSEVAILHQNFLDFSTCTSLLNIKTFEWTKVTHSLTDDLPLGGFILQGIESHRTFYIGGNSQHDRTDDMKRVFELTNRWELLKTKLEFGIAGWNSMVLDSRLNITKCLADSDIWPVY